MVIDVCNEVEIDFTGAIQRDDQDFEEEIKEINRKLENLCKGKGIVFINNIDGSCFSRSKLHLNKSGAAQLTVADKTFNFPTVNNTSNVSLLEDLRIKILIT